MKKITMTLLTIALFSSLLEANSLTDEQKQMKEMILKISVPMLEVSKKIKKCTTEDSKENYIGCMQKLQSEFKTTKLGSVFGKNMGEIDGKLWQNKSEIVKLDETITKMESSVECANNPKTINFMSCMK